MRALRLRVAAAVPLLAAPLLLAAVSCSAPPPRVRPGIEVLLSRRLDLVRSKRVGLVTNPTGTDSNLRSTIDLLAAAPGVRLAALFGPEHGARGEAQAGSHVASETDPRLGIPVFSLYGATRKPSPEMLLDPDGKGPLDVLVFDIQDVGTRAYTYTSTLAYCLEACAEAGVDCVVLDRPNPLGGIAMEGPVLEHPEQSSFVGLYPIPVRHGMTVGELALLFCDRFLPRRPRLAVVPMEGWRRGLWFDETGLPWVPPSPNMPSLDTAIVYPGQVLLEGTNVSEGRGTTKPFELFGAPWTDGRALAERLNALGLPGAVFREARFTPTFSKYQGELCGGVQVHVLDRRKYRPFETTLHAIRALLDLHPGRFEFRPDAFDRLAGTRAVREALERGEAVETIVERLEPGLAEFARLRRPYLLY